VPCGIIRRRIEQIKCFASNGAAFNQPQLIFGALAPADTLDFLKRRDQMAHWVVIFRGHRFTSALRPADFSLLVEPKFHCLGDAIGKLLDLVRRPPVRHQYLSGAFKTLGLIGTVHILSTGRPSGRLFYCERLRWLCQAD
jgi:hypothetical protein